MKPELQAKLFNTFPHLLRVLELHDARGITCGDGWFDIIYNLCTAMTTIIDDPSTPYTRADIRVSCVKEKEAELKFYHDYLNGKKRSEAIQKAYERAQALSNSTCETCGELGEVDYFVSEWLKIRCKRCEWSYRYDNGLANTPVDDAETTLFDHSTQKWPDPFVDRVESG